MPDMDWLDGSENCLSAWDVLASTAALSGDVIFYDGTGRHEAISTALHLAERGASVHFVTMDESLAQEVEYSSRAVYRKQFKQRGIRTTPDHALVKVSREGGNGLKATFLHELTGDVFELTAPTVVVERGTTPFDGLFHDLASRSCNRGVIDNAAFVEMRPQPVRSGENGFELYRLGDAVASRNVHAAMYDAMRLCLIF
jgi:hypothetical protein